MPANSNNKNELLMATIGITNTARSNLMGITFLTRRLNVVPNIDEPVDTKTAAKDSKTAKLLKINSIVPSGEKSGDKPTIHDDIQPAGFPTPPMPGGDNTKEPSTPSAPSAK